ncbi:hypothetical protein [Candidatus Frankia nodulisporulans]|uniref:hypothetical protein n=1 Tax=Candidatus Frankia nodulisporulans TaxID=2060052 RepID=UPI0013D3B351|nr:hypothetical protein [Candidatus Frankia nodulisporulans]
MTGTGAVGVGGDGQAVPTGTPTEVPGQDRCGSGHWSARSRTEPSEQVTLVGCSVGWSVVPGSDPQIGVAAGAGAAPLAGWPGWPGRGLGHCGEFPVPVGQVASAVRCAGVAEVLGQDRPGQSASAEAAGVDVADGQGPGPVDGGGGAQLSVCPPVAALPEAATTPFVAITGTRETVAFGGQAVGLGDSQAGTNALEAMLARQSPGWVGQALVAEAVGDQLAEPGEVMPALGVPVPALGVPVVGGDVPGVPGVPVPVDGVPVVGLVVAAVGAGVVGSGFGSALGVEPPVGDPASPEPPEPPPVGGPVVVADPPPEVGEAPSVVVSPAPAAGVDPVELSVAAALVGSPAAAALIGTPAPAGAPSPVATPAPTHSSRTLRKMTATEPRDDRSPRDAPNRDDRAVHRPAARWPDTGRPPGANGNTAITARQHSSLKTRGARLTLRA